MTNGLKEQPKWRIGIDVMGSESPPHLLFNAVIQAAKSLGSEVKFFLFVTKEIAALLLKQAAGQKLDLVGPNIDFSFVQEYITMDDAPLVAIRQKKRSSIAIGIKKLRDQKIDAFITAGNTGAVIACSTFFLPPFPGCDRSALLACLPAKGSSLAVIDVGGRVSCRACHLVQFAHVGAAFQRCSLDIQKPKVGLLNIGGESKKGTPELQLAYQTLQHQAQNPLSKITFVGNIEGRDVFQGVVDVLVTDGFTGNVLLKASEGISDYILEYFQQLMSDKAALHNIVERVKHQFNYEEYPGALVCGVNGIVIKCHGAVTEKALFNSILRGLALLRNDFLNNLQVELNFPDK